MQIEEQLRTESEDNLSASIEREVISPCAYLGKGRDGGPGH